MTGPLDAGAHGGAAALHETLRLIEAHQQRLQRMRRWRVLVVTGGVSLLAHLVLMYFLATQYWMRGGGGGESVAVSFEFAILPEEELAELGEFELETLSSGAVGAEDLTLGEVGLDAVPAAALEVAGSGALPALGGSGAGSGGEGAKGLGGGGAGGGASFFGVSSRGTRFAYVVDRSASMGEGRKMPIAMRELIRSISGLADFASFHVVLFSTEPVVPPGPQGWTRARPGAVNRLVRWLDTIDPSGGTVPLPAFHEIFALDVRPDVIFFLTDGEIPEDTADGVAHLNAQGGGRVVINTIAFGEDASQDQLRRIAEESGGRYRFVPTETAP